VRGIDGIAQASGSLRRTITLPQDQRSML